jgi:hypothetical protein
VQGRGGGKEEQGRSHAGGVPTFTGGGNGLVATDHAHLAPSIYPHPTTIEDALVSSPISPHL